MRSSDQGTGPPKELAQLLRLRQVRVDAAEAAVRLQRAECEQAAAAVQARLHQIEANRCNVNNHATYAVGQGASDLARMPTLFSASSSRRQSASGGTSKSQLQTRCAGFKSVLPTGCSACERLDAARPRGV